MKQEELTQEEKERIRSYIRKVVISYLLFGILVFLVFLAIILVIKSTEMVASKDTELAIIISIILSVVTGYVILFYKAINKPTSDLKVGLKEIIKKKLTDKFVQSVNIEKNESLNFSEARQYFITTDDMKFAVREEDYERFNIGDEINIYITPRSKMILGIKK